MRSPREIRSPLFVTPSPTKLNDQIFKKVQRLKSRVSKGEQRILISILEIDLLISYSEAGGSVRRRLTTFLASDIQVVQSLIAELKVDRTFLARVDSFNFLETANELQTNNKDHIRTLFLGHQLNGVTIKEAVDQLCKYSEKPDIRLIAADSLALEILREASTQIGLCKALINGKESFFGHYVLPDISARTQTENNEQVTLISSLYNGAQYIPSYIENLIRQSYFGSSRIMIFDAGPGTRDLDLLSPYLQSYLNISYFKLKCDPGLYDIWNLGVHLANTPYIGNANLDDRRHPLQLELLCGALESDETISVVSSQVVPISDYKVEHFDNDLLQSEAWYSWLEGRYDLADLWVYDSYGKPSSQCIPHCMPIWRKDIHDKAGYFNEEAYSSAADFEFWLRNISDGVGFAIVPHPLSYYYVNPRSYMRVDKLHQAIVDRLHGIYAKKSSRRTRPHWPNLAGLEEWVSFRIN